jgi:hypothetical protein
MLGWDALPALCLQLKHILHRKFLLWYKWLFAVAMREQRYRLLMTALLRVTMNMLWHH